MLPSAVGATVISGESSYQKAVDIAGASQLKIQNGGARVAGMWDSRGATDRSLSVNNFVTAGTEMIRQSEGALQSYGLIRETSSNSNVYGYSGATTTQIVAALANITEDYPDVSVWYGGYNDRTGSNPWSTAEYAGMWSNIMAWNQWCLTNGVRGHIMAETGNTSQTTQGDEQLESHNNLLRRYCERHPHLSFAPLHMVLNDPTTGTLNTAYTGDNTHLNIAGAEIAGAVALESLRGGAAGCFPYLATSNTAVYTATYQYPGAPLNFPNPTAHSATTGYTTLGGGTITTAAYDAGSRGLGNWINFEKTTSSTRYIYTEQATLPDGFFTSGDRLFAGCRAAIVSGSTNVGVEMGVDRSTLDAMMSIASVTDSVHGDFLCGSWVPTATPTRLRLIFNVIDLSTFGANQHVRMGQPTIVNISAMDRFLDTYSLFPA